MRKFIIVLSAVFMLSFTANAQEIGFRGGLMSGNFGALDGVFSFEGSRIHANLSFGSSGIGVDAFYDFLYGDLGDSPINYYIGLGAGVNIGDPLVLVAAAEFGLEYRFSEVPIVIGADYRPYFTIIHTDGTGAGFDNFGLNVRWVF